MLLALAAITASAPAAHAQSFFDGLFGSGAPSPPASRPDTFGSAPPPAGPDRFEPYASESDDAYADPRDAQSLSKAGGYRTMCVRMCDGYYWPISSSAQHGKFYSDAKVCQASCDMEARLFYLPRASDDIASMRDLTGRVYGRLPAAFAYRKAMDGACLCKPEPWSEAQALRHQAYAAASVENGQASATTVETSSTAAVPAPRRRYAPRRNWLSW